MRGRIRFRFLLQLLCLLAPEAHAKTAHELVSQLQTAYFRITSVEASFSQTYRSKRFGEKKASGKVVFVKPGKMRWDYDSPKGKVMVSDGSKVVLYDPEDQQAI